MIWTALATRLRQGKAEVQRAMRPPEADSSAMNFPEWYAGLAVSPVAFSRQLGEMQASLLRANAPLGSAERAGSRAEAKR